MERPVDDLKPMVIHATGWDEPVAIELREEQQRELRAMYEGDAEPGIKPSASDMAVFLVAFRGPAALACGGLRLLDDHRAEIKRMYVRPDHRGQGISRLLLAELERRALAVGRPDLVLETGPLQAAAIGLYESAGYQVIPNFEAYRDSPTSVCFGKSLA